MAGPASPSPYALLTRLFLRQFLENDLVSPDADRSQLLAVVGALALCLTLFVSMFLSSLYLGAALTPGQAAVLSLDDKFFYLALAMVATALVAAAQWDTLALDPRDAAILEPLPVPAGVVRRAKLTAIALLGAGVAVGLNLIPSVVFPWLLIFGFPQMTLGGLLWLVLTHFALTTAAAVFGYLVVIALREALVALAGRRGFAVISPWAQGALIIVLGSSLLLLMPAAKRIARDGFDDWRAATPPMWFLGAYERIAGDVVADQPRGRMTPRQQDTDRVTGALYAQRRERFPALALRAAQAFGAVALVAALGYAWNARRLPALAPAPPAARQRRWRTGARVLNAVVVRDPAARAGFYFALAALWRSRTHRLTLACAAAAGFAMAVVALSRAGVDVAGVAPPGLLVMQPLLYGALLVGFRHLVRVPAELRANWGVQLAWRNRERAFTAGVKRAALLVLAAPAIALLAPLYAYVMGAPLALAHAALGLAGAVVLLEALMVSYEKVPFTCSYLPDERLKALGPIYGVAFIIGAVLFARLQHAALNGIAVGWVVVTLAAAFVAARLLALTRTRMPAVEFDEAPAGSVQRLGLHV